MKEGNFIYYSVDYEEYDVKSNVNYTYQVEILRVQENIRILK